jgi:hypothetical protein
MELELTLNVAIDPMQAKDVGEAIPEHGYSSRKAVSAP